MYNRIFKTLENRFKEYESLEKYLDSHIEELQTENQKLLEQIAILKSEFHARNHKLVEQISILKAELNAAYSQLNQGLTE